LLSLCFGAACVQSRTPPVELQNPFLPVAFSELRHPESLNGKRVSFTATIERVEETTGGTWMHLASGGEKVVLYVPMAFGGTLRDSLEGDMTFEVTVGEKKLTQLGVMALEVMPFQISNTHYFEHAITIPAPVEATPAAR
jgi:hypothetical protein